MEDLRETVNNVLRETYTRAVCRQHVDQLNERVALQLQPNSLHLAAVLETAFAANLRTIEHCREIYPGEFEPWQVLNKNDAAQ